MFNLVKLESIPLKSMPWQPGRPAPTMVTAHVRTHGSDPLVTSSTEGRLSRQEIVEACTTMLGADRVLTDEQTLKDNSADRYYK
ncbi:MAG TPA: hypothetical protein VJ976_07840, partial [Ornithinimicrobium sp.]|uniref:hypothetical protein n=1 Tax=Ornithinimicrobium sp. TaxID=1977084 RepID=UPI002B458E34